MCEVGAAQENVLHCFDLYSIEIYVASKMNHYIEDC